jgi:hypothetical protein
MLNDLGPERLTLRQTDQAREGFARWIAPAHTWALAAVVVALLLIR